MALLSGAVFAFMAANEDNGCAPEQAGGNEAECNTASDCQGDPGIDCVGAWACNTGQCEFECGSEPPPPPPPTGCYGDEDCRDGLVCNAAEVCHAPPGCERGQDCPAVCYGECVRPTEPTGCYSSEQCAPGEYCTTETGACDSTCAPGMACPDVCRGECKPRNNGSICYSDSECSAGQFCDFDPCVFPEADASGGADRIACGGVCSDRVDCSTDADCDRGEFCGCAPFPGETPPNGLMPCYMQCQPRETQCSADVECAAGQVCQNGVCVEPQRECYDNSQCPAGWTCESQCGGTDDPNGANIYCPSVCVPAQNTCADTGVACGPGEVCVNECVTVCNDCAFPGDDCGGCWEECRSACIPEYGQCNPEQCPEGTHCGCADAPYYTPANGLYYCEETCIPDQRECWSDSECGTGEYCAPSDCTQPVPEPCDPASGEACDAERPAPPMCPGVCVQHQNYDCTSDRDCYSADGRQGVCKFDVCESFAPDCAPDDPNCGVGQTCYGFCAYDNYPTTCNPWDPTTCAPGTHCEAVSQSCAGSSGSDGGGAEFMPCLVEYQCVPDEGMACATDCDCPDYLSCGDGVCQAMNRMNECWVEEGCTSDSECGEGQYCNIDYDQPVCACAGCPCSIPRGTCEVRETEQCNTDSDCGDGEYCGCGSDPSCPMCDVCFFQCMPRYDGGCKEDSDCGAGQHCEFYYPPCANPGDDFALPPACEPIGMCEANEPTGGDCRVQGCSGQVCSDADNVVTTCEYLDYYACYRYAICDYDAAGVCGWQKTDAYVECMSRYNAE